MTFSKKIEAGYCDVSKFNIFSNYNQADEDFRARFHTLCIYESLFDSTVRASCEFIDSGYETQLKSASTEGDYNVTAGERCELRIKDSDDNELEFENDYHLRVRAHTKDQSLGPSNRTTTFYADFYSLESMTNHLLATRPTQKFDGYPHDHIRTLLTENLGTSKVFESDETIIPYNFLGYNEKVFYHCFNLCNKGIPPLEVGTHAGFLFYEVAKGTGSTGGYRYRSIDKLFQQSPKKKYIYNNTEKTPNGYDGKIITYHETRDVNAERDIMLADTFQRKMQTFDPRLKAWSEKTFDPQSQNQYNAGKEFYKITSDDDLNLQSQPTRYSTRVYDIGTLPKGRVWDEQKQYCNEIDGLGHYRIDESIAQAESRLNQILGTQVQILLPMDLSLHVGDLIEIDFPEISADKKYTEISRNKSGIYMIADLSHKLSISKGYTSLNIVRDSTTYKK